MANTQIIKLIRQDTAGKRESHNEEEQFILAGTINELSCQRNKITHGGKRYIADICTAFHGENSSPQNIRDFFNINRLVCRSNNGVFYCHSNRMKAVKKEKGKVVQLPKELTSLGFVLEHEEGKVPTSSLPLKGYTSYTSRIDRYTSHPKPAFTNISYSILGNDVTIIIETSQGETLVISFNKKSGDGNIANYVTRDGQLQTQKRKAVTYIPYWNNDVDYTYQIVDAVNRTSEMSLTRNGNTYTVRGKCNDENFNETFTVTNNPVEGRRLESIHVIDGKILEIRYRRPPVNSYERTLTDPKTGEKYVPSAIHARKTRSGWNIHIFTAEPGKGNTRGSGNSTDKTAQILIDSIIIPK